MKNNWSGTASSLKRILFPNTIYFFISLLAHQREIAGSPQKTIADVHFLLRRVIDLGSSIVVHWGYVAYVMCILPSISSSSSSIVLAFLGRIRRASSSTSTSPRTS